MKPTSTQTPENQWLGFPRAHLIATGGLALALSATLFLFPSENAEAIKLQPDTAPLTSAVANLPAPNQLSPTTELAEQITLPEAESAAADLALAAEALSVELETEPEPVWQSTTVRSGDNLSLIFHKNGLSDREVYRFVNSKDEAKALTRIKPGDAIQMQVDDTNNLIALRYQPNRLETHTFTRTDEGFTFERSAATPDVRTSFRTGTIESSLFLAGMKAGLDDSLVMEMANIFGWDIDFVLDIRQGDSFKILYEEQFLDGEKFSNGRILAAEFVNQGKTFQALRYENKEGIAHFYTPAGDSMRKAFLRTPVDFARISSSFNLNRRHPILNTIRAHKGTDYAAASGTPIRAVGDGKVIFAGNGGGYGNVVKIQHGQKYQTRYAHMSKFGRGIRKGTTVKQGQIIGYVGMTGLATGPHLHYEFYVNGSVRNPVTVPLPKAQSVPQAEMARFAQQTQPLLAQLSGDTHFAQSNSATP